MDWSDQVITQEHLDMSFEEANRIHHERSNMSAFDSFEDSLSDHYRRMAEEQAWRNDPYADNINRMMDIVY